MDSFRSSIENNQKAWLFGASGAILALAALLRLWNLGAESAWIDEAYSIELARYSLQEIIRGTAADQHPPLYYLLLSLWLRLGDGVGYARLLSAVLGVISVGQLMHFGYKSGGVFIGLVGGLLLALSPVHIWYSQEIRMYMLLLVMTTSASSALWWALQKRKTIYWILYALFSILALYTHYFSIFVILGHGIWVVVWHLKSPAKNDLWKWITSSAVTALFLIPWLPTAINQARFHTMTWVESPSLSVIRDTLIRLLFGAAALALPEFLLWLILLILIGVFIWAFKSYLVDFAGEGNTFFFTVSWGTIPFLMISIIALIYPIYQFKQYLIVLVPLLLLYAWINYILPKSLRITALVVIILSVSFSLVYQQVTLSKDDWRGAALYLAENASQGDVIFSNPAAASLAFEQYQDIKIPFYGIPAGYDIITGGWEGEMITPGSAEEILEQLSEGYQRVWLVEFFPEFWDAAGSIENWLEIHAGLVEEHWFGRIHIRIYEFG